MLERLLATISVLACASPLLVSGCSYKVSGERNVTPEKIGTAQAQLQGYMRSRNGFEEETPGDIRHSVIIDEARLAKVGDGEMCFRTTVRTGSRTDEPLSELDPHCVVDDGEEVDAIPEGETLRVVDYGYRGREKNVLAEGVAAGEYMGLQLSTPAEKTFRVIERQAKLCCPASATESVELIMENRRMGVNNPYGVRFVWQIR